MNLQSHPNIETDNWGIDNGYIDALEKWQPISAETRRTLQEVMGDPVASHGSVGHTHLPLVVQQAEQFTLASHVESLLLEDGTLLPISQLSISETISETRLDALPLGYHQACWADGSTQLLIVAPRTCFLQEDKPLWGWSAQLYATRSERSWGMGDLADLKDLARWSAESQAGFIMVNPLNAVVPIAGQQPSPYSPTSRRFFNPLYLRIEEIPRAAEFLGADRLQQLAQAGRELNRERIIDREQVLQLKVAALEGIWQTLTSSERQNYRDQASLDLQEYSSFCVLAEHFGPDWRRWPQAYRDPSSVGVQKFAQEHADRVAYHCWQQRLIEDQLKQASQELPILHDLPIGVDPGGADAWAWQGILAQGVGVGAPPDIYESAGQNWGLAPFVPHRLQRAGYRPYIDTIRALLRHAGGLRIDHVMGMFRLFWIPQGREAKDGAFVRYPAEDLLSILALESQRAGAFIVGEDLGTVDSDVRKQLSKRKILSTRLTWFEDEPTTSYPRNSFAAFTTHDLPTMAGMWTGADVVAEQAIGKEPNLTALLKNRQRLQHMLGVESDCDVEELIQKMYALIAQAPSVVVAATLDDALAVKERPNMPGTLDQWPNWSIALPKTIEEIKELALPQIIADLFASRIKPV